MPRLTKYFSNTQARSETAAIYSVLRGVACAAIVGGVLALTQAFASDPAEPQSQPINKRKPASATALAQNKSKFDATGLHAEHDEILQACAKACSDCQRECDLCATRCGRLLADGNRSHLATLMTCRDCATVCTAAAQIVAGSGPFSAIICESCTTACAECAKTCEAFPDDKPMRACAEECRKCEKACRDMLKHSGGK